MGLLRALLLSALLACAGPAALAGDVIHLRNGRMLRGAVVAETDTAVVVRLGTGTMTVPRTRIRLVERGTRGEDPSPTVTQRDEWFLVLHRDRVAGWRRVVHTEGPRRVTVEERTVFFRPGGGDDVDVRRVETSTPDGRPLEFLHMETYRGRMDLTSGERVRGRWTVRVTRDGETRTRDLDAGDGWVLALPAWSCFLETAKPGETRAIVALDPRTLTRRRLLLKRDPEDAVATADDRGRPCRALRLVGDTRRTRAFYRPGQGALAVELNGRTLVARRSTRERVEFARRANAAPEPMHLDEALLYPFYRREKDRRAWYPRAGLALETPDAAWVPDGIEADRGRVVAFEKVSLFASFEVFSYATDDPDPDACLALALARFRLTATTVAARGAPRATRVAGREARAIELDARHRGEDLRCLVVVVPAGDRYVMVVGACPARWWRWAAGEFEAFVDALVVVR